MKKYIELRENDILTEKDECRYVYGKKWIPNVHSSQMEGFEYRRPVPYSGKVAFLVTYSPTIRVVIDTTGLNDEQIDEKLVDAARSKFKVYREHHMNEFGDNIDWEWTKEDTEVPFIETSGVANYMQSARRGEYPVFSEINPFVEGEPSGMGRLVALQAGIDKGFINDSIATEPKNPGKKALDYCNAQHNQGIGIAWVISDTGNGRLQVQRIDEPEHEGLLLFPLESDETAWDIAKSLGWKLDENGYVLAYPGEEPKNPGKYRILAHGEEILRTDEVRASYVVPIPMDEEWEVVGESITWDVEGQNNGYVSEQAADGMWFRRPITDPQYRPFVEGDVIEEGDEFRFNENDSWRVLTVPFPQQVVDQSIIDSGDFRKLIK